MSLGELDQAVLADALMAAGATHEEANAMLALFPERAKLAELMKRTHLSLADLSEVLSASQDVTPSNAERLIVNPVQSRALHAEAGLAMFDRFAPLMGNRLSYMGVPIEENSIIPLGAILVVARR